MTWTQIINLATGSSALLEVKLIDCGVPQGSRLGPLLFSVFSNEWPLILEQAMMSMHADEQTEYTASVTIDKLGSADSGQMDH